MADKEFDILDKEYRIIARERELKMSHWIRNFRIIDNRNNRIIFDLIPSLWDFYEYKAEGDSLKVLCRKYPDGDRIYEVDFDLYAKTIRFEGKTCPIEGSEKLFEEVG